MAYSVNLCQYKWLYLVSLVYALRYQIWWNARKKYILSSQCVIYTDDEVSYRKGGRESI